MSVQQNGPDINSKVYKYIIMKKLYIAYQTYSCEAKK